jgi:hypothetical protein
MATVNITTVRKQCNAWDTHNYENNQRGKTAVAFTQCGDQWDSGVVNDRIVNNKESLVFNHSLKHLNRLKAQLRELEFTLNMTPANKEYQENVAETNALRLLMESITLNENMLSEFQRGGDKAAEFGYAFAEVNYRRESDMSLSLEPTVRVHKDPSIAFYDINAQDPTKIDGQFMGLRREISKDAFLRKYPQYKNDNNWLKMDGNELIDYWYRDYEEREYCLLKTGIYKRKDLLTLKDEPNLATADDYMMAMEKYDPKGREERPQPISVKGTVCFIYYKRFCNERVVEKATRFPTKDLPLPYHPGFTVWKKDAPAQTFAYTYPLQGPQKLHNYLYSQVATLAKNTNDPIWFTEPENVQTKTQITAFTEINKSGGTIVVNDIEKIRKEAPQELPLSLLQGAQSTKQSLDEIAGMNNEMQQSDALTISRTALDKISHNIDLNNIGFLASHIYWINQIAKLIRQMLPEIITEQRTLVVSKKDGDTETIIVNEELVTGDIRNNIKDVNDNFKYEIKAGPSSTMIKQTNLKYLQEAFAMDPTLFHIMGDIWARNLDTPDAEEISLRISASYIDPDLVKFSQGAISKEEYQKSQQQKQQQQMQQQMQMMQMSPEFQAMMKKAATDQMHAQTDQFKAQSKHQIDMINAHTKIQAELSDAHYKQAQLKLEYMEAMQGAKTADGDHMLSVLREKLNANQQVIDILKAKNQEAHAEPKK